MRIDGMSLHNLSAQMEKHSVISFDFFDTLFLRKLEEPETVFDLVGHHFKISDFRVLRKKAQQLAFIEMHSNKKHEINIDDIYNNFHELNELQKQQVKNYEVKIELDVICPNWEIIDLYLNAIKLGKQVVITSDMYLTEDYFIKALNKFSLPIVKLFISADKDCTKRDFGNLFDMVIASTNAKASDILHIGDNLLADVHKAHLKGLSAYHYESMFSSQRRNVDISESITNGLINSRINKFPDDSGEKFAYQYGGPTVVGFQRWLQKVTKGDKIDALFYLARDGYMIKKFSERNKGSFCSKELYFKGSRTSFILSSITEANFSEHIPYFLSGAYELSVHEIFERIGVSAPAQTVLDDLGFTESIAIKNQSYKNIYNLLHSMKKNILNVCRENRRGLHQLLVELNLPADANIGLVDVGWKGSTQDAFENAIRPFFEYNVHGYYFCLLGSVGNNKKAMVDSAIYGKEIINKIYANRVAFELIFSAPHETVIGHIPDSNKIKFIEDQRRTKTHNFFMPLEKGMNLFFDEYDEFSFNIDFTPSTQALIQPLVNFAVSEEWKNNKYISYIQNFDAWSATENITFLPSQYS